MNVSQLKLRLFNVGQGDHILLELPDGSYGIIDCNFCPKKGWGTLPVVELFEYLRSINEQKLIKVAFLCISHPDLDHLKGLDELLELVESDDNIIIERIWRFPGLDITEFQNALKTARDSDSSEGALSIYLYLGGILNKLNDYINQNKVEVQYITAFQDIENGIAEMIDAKCLAPLSSKIQKLINKNLTLFLTADDKQQKMVLGNKNHFSTAIQLEFGENRLLFGGDVEIETWEECIKASKDRKQKINWKSNFIKAAHHGATNASSPFIWENILSDNLTHIAVSAGSEKHPGLETIKHISEVGRPYKLIGTSVCGNCLENDDLDSIEAEWLYDYQKNPDEKWGFRESGSNKKAKKNKRATVISYIFEFFPNDKNVKVTKELSKNVKKESCIYPVCPLK